MTSFHKTAQCNWERASVCETPESKQQVLRERTVVREGFVWNTGLNFTWKDSQIPVHGKGAQHGGLLSREGYGEEGRIGPACLEQILGERETTVPRSSKARLKI